LRARDQARRERRRRLIVGGLAGGLAIALILLAFALTQSSIARENAAQAERSAATAEAEYVSRATAQAMAESAELDARTQASVGLASQSARELELGLPERAVLLALESLENYPYTWQAEQALGQAVFDNHLRLVLDQGEWASTWSPDGTRILATASDGARLWDAETGQLLLTFQHDAPNGAVWSSDGQHILTYGGGEAVGYQSSGGSGTARVWDATSGELVFTLEGHEAGIMSAEWSPKGDRILTASLDNSARIWEATTGKLLVTFTGHETGVDTCNILCTPGSSAWSPEGDRVVTGDQAGEIYIWDPGTGEKLVHLMGHTEWVNTTVWSPDGTRIASTADDGTARIWDASTGEELFSYSLPQALRAYWSPDGERVMFVAWNGVDVIMVVNASSGEQLAVFDRQVNPCWADWSADGTLVVSGGREDVKVWNSTTGEIVHEFRGHPLGACVANFSPTNDQVVSSGNGTANVWDLADELTILKIPGDGGGRWPAIWSPNGDRIARMYEDGSVRVFDAITGEQQIATAAPSGGVSSRLAFAIDFSPSGEELLVVYNDGIVRIWDSQSGEKLLEVSRESEWWEGEWSPDGSKFATGSVDGVIQIWDARTGQELLSFLAHDKEIFWTRWSPDGRQIVSNAGNSGEAKLWDAETGQLVRNLTPEGSEVTVHDVAWSPDGKRLATVGLDGIVSFWDLTTGERWQSTGGHISSTRWVDWFPGQDRVLISDIGGEIKVWDVATGTEIASFGVPGSHSAVLSPDGHQVLDIIRPDGGPLVIFKIWQNLDELKDLAKECCVFRDLTPEERQQFGLPPVVQAE
ncbi:MAG: WD40 repeat domain-containing protein, partial [Anaerolineae bacterium]|nr:WD40 repeat domain-containing protein [Anaerolineae bacterium]